MEGAVGENSVDTLRFVCEGYSIVNVGHKYVQSQTIATDRNNHIKLIREHLLCKII